MSRTRPLVPSADARRLLLDSAGLLADPRGRAGPRTVERTIERLGYVQIDAIAMSARAHDHILMTRHDGYRPSTLVRLLEGERRLFEHWTHDASVIPIAWYPMWKRRFKRARERGVAPNVWWRKRIGPDADRVVRRVLKRLEAIGPAPASAIAEEGRASDGGFWSWTPAKSALEYAWRAGLVAIAGRRDFTKLYDLAERVHPDGHAAQMPSVASHLAWACREAMERLVVATPGEIAEYLAAVPAAEARAWAKAAAGRGELIEVDVEDATDGIRATRAFALPEWRARAADLPATPDRARALSPFDPAIRDRKRARRRFGFDYRFEAFTPAAKRRYGYYVLPILDGERLIARIDVKHDRGPNRLRVLGWWWESGLEVDTHVRDRAESAVDRYSAQIGADAWTRPGRRAERRADPVAN